MNEKEKAINIRDEFTAEFDKTLKMLMDNYPRVSRVKCSKEKGSKEEKEAKQYEFSKNVFDITINTILIDMLKQIQIDCNRLSINEFHKKHVSNLPILYRWDFSSAEFKEIIESSYLSERDKKIAIKFFIDKKSITDVQNEIDEIEDKKTVSNNLDKINDTLLHAACKYNRLNH